MRNSFAKTWNVLLPFVLYYIVYNTAYIVLAFLLNVGTERFGEAFWEGIFGDAETVHGAMAGLSMLIGICPLIGMLKKEIAGRNQNSRGNLRSYLLTILLACSSSLGLNILLGLTGIVDSSKNFQEVSDSQFGVAFGVGIILYGVVSPLAEEVIFRGLLYNRMRTLFPIPLAVAASGLLFGCYHGNLVQGIYGTCMGILLAYVYECFDGFAFPVAFHAAANIVIYVIGTNTALQEVVFRPAFAVICLAISGAGLVMSWRKRDDYCRSEKD